MAKIPTLETGFRVETRNGNRYIVMAYEGTWTLLNKNGYMNKDSYDKDFKCLKDGEFDTLAKEYDIIKIYDRTDIYNLLNLNQKGSLLWQRNETELTAKEAFELMKEICPKQGCFSCILNNICDPACSENDNSKLLLTLQSYKEEHGDV